MDAAAWDERYAATELVWSAGPNRFVADHTSSLDPGRALDLACGEGRNALWLAERGWNATGIDFSPVAVDKARRIAAHRRLDAEFLVGDVTDPDVVGAGGTVTYDLVVSAYLHLPPDEAQAALTAACAVVAPGGTLLVLGHHVDNPDRGYGGPPVRAILHDPDSIATVIADAGLTIARAGEVVRTVDTDDGPRTAIDSLVIASRSAG